MNKVNQVWERARVWECLSTDDKLCWTSVPNVVVSKCSGDVKCVDLADGQVLSTIHVEDDDVLAVTVTHHLDEIVTYTAHKSGLVRKWVTAEMKGPEIALKADHRGPILSMLTVKDRYLITIGSDYVAKVWDVEKRHLLGILRGLTSVPNCGSVSEEGKLVRVAVGLADGSIKTWTLTEDGDGDLSCQTAAISLDKHNSQISCLTFVGSKLVAGGRDQLISVWNMADHSCQHLIPTYEEVEQVFPLKEEEIRLLVGSVAEAPYCATAGSKGRIRVWNVASGAEVGLVADQPPVHGQITDLHFDSGAVYVVSDDLILKTENGESTVVPMNQNEVLDFTLVGSKLIIATNAPYLRIYDFEDQKMTLASAPNAHTDAVLAVASLKPLDKVPSENFVSCGKDQNVCLWRMTPGGASLLAKGTGHTSYVGAVGLSTDGLFSASKDGILKSWSLPEEGDETLKTKRTIAAHPQEINSLDVSFDGQVVVTGSQDKTAKLWRVSDLGLLGTLSGHRRGIWSTKFFYEANRLLIATASADCTVKLWEKNTFGTYACIQTLEGHLSSVLSITHLPDRKLATVSSDGLLKIWSFENNFTSDVGSFDAHDDKIWAVEAVEDKIVTGGRDGQMVLWENVTQRVREEEKAKEDETIKTDQKLNNYIHTGQLSKALKICLRTGKPRLARETLVKLRKKGGLKEALQKLNLEERNVLHGLLVKWNSFGPQCALAQDVLKVLLVEAMIHDQKLSSSQCSGLISYSEKHYQRLDKLESRLAVVDLLLDNM